MRYTGAQLTWHCLVREGVQVVFGIPGGSVIPLYHRLPDYPIRHVLMRHEQAAVHAADGYARASGRVGVCLATSGPGTTNLVTGLATAHAAHASLVALTGQAATSVLGSDAFQEVDIVGVTMPVTMHNDLVTTVEDLASILHNAFDMAGGDEPGPVLVAIPTDVQLQQTDLATCGPARPPSRPARPAVEPPGEAAPCPDTLAALLAALTGSGPGPAEGLVLVADSAWALYDLAACRPGLVLTPGRLETRGFALPAAIGAQIALPGHQVWVLTDGLGFQANLQELATIIQERLPLRIVVLNKGAAAPGPDLALLAAAYSIQAITIHAGRDLPAAFWGALAAGEPVLLDLRLP